MNNQAKMGIDTDRLLNGGPLAGRTVVFTGKVEPYTRAGLRALLEELGGHAASAVSGNTDYLVCGENPGSKLGKARNLGVKILTPAQFFTMAEQ